MNLLRKSASLAVALSVLASAASASMLSHTNIKLATFTPISQAAPGHVEFNMSKEAVQRVGTVAYECLTFGSSYYANSNVTGAYGDDCHLALSGPLIDFTIGYFSPSGAVDCLITFHSNNAANTTFGAIEAGPYIVTGLPGGANTVTITPPDTPALSTDVWYTIQFSLGDAGLIIAGAAPTVGTSDDVFVDVDALSLLFFGGSPVANFALAISLDQPVPTKELSLGALKQQFSERSQ